MSGEDYKNTVMLSELTVNQQLQRIKKEMIDILVKVKTQYTNLRKYNYKTNLENGRNFKCAL